MRAMSRVNVHFSFSLYSSLSLSFSLSFSLFHSFILSFSHSFILSFSLFSVSLSLYSLSFLSFGRGMKGPRAGSRQRQHSTAVTITVIIYTIMIKLNKLRKEDTSSWPDCQARDAATDTNEENGTRTNPLFSWKLFRLKASYLCACQTHPLGTQRDFHVSALCVEDPSPPPSASIIDAVDATHRRHHSTRTFVANHQIHLTMPPINTSHPCISRQLNSFNVFHFRVSPKLSRLSKPSDPPSWTPSKPSKPSKPPIDAIEATIDAIEAIRSSRSIEAAHSSVSSGAFGTRCTSKAIQAETPVTVLTSVARFLRVIVQTNGVPSLSILLHSCTWAIPVSCDLFDHHSASPPIGSVSINFESQRINSFITNFEL